jgi:peptidoglycan biosynthesis protein MviN/MurJ (putative lipid II flippase)
VNLAFYERFGFRAVALGTALGAIANAALLAFVFERRHGGLLREGALRRMAQMAMGACVMAVALVPVVSWLEAAAGTAGLGAQLATGLLPVALGVGFYGTLVLALRLPEAALLLDLVRRGRRPDAS